MKTCFKCQNQKPATATFFGKDTNRSDGLHPQCKACLALYRAANRDRINAKVRELYIVNKERYQVKQNAWREAHRLESAERTRAWNAANGANPEVKAQRATYGRYWRAMQPHKNTAKSEKYRAKQLQRIPTWADEIDWVFSEAAALAKLREKMLGGKWHVDHILPLQGRLVSGLHVMDNLQVVPAPFNIRKRNSFNPTIGPNRFLG